MKARMGKERESKQIREREREDERRQEKSFVCQVHSPLGMFVCRSTSGDAIIAGDAGMRVNCKDGERKERQAMTTRRTESIRWACTRHHNQHLKDNMKSNLTILVFLIN